jgi:hypothetical protein
MEEMKGYTEEEFQALLALMGLSSLFKITSGSNMLGSDTPEERFLIIESYRKAIAARNKAGTNKKDEITGYTEEEFQALLPLLGLRSFFAKREDGVDTPEDRFFIIEAYRKAIAAREKAVANGR